MKIDEGKLREVMAAVLQVDVVYIDEQSSADTIPGWDSLKHINLILALEQEFGVSFPDEDVANLSSYALLRLALTELVVP